MKKGNKNIKAFTLIEMSIVIVIIATVAYMALSAGSGMVDANRKKVSDEKAIQITKLLKNYVETHGHLPCPANDLPNTDDNYGISATRIDNNVQVCDVHKNSHDIASGLVPFRTLGITDEYARDGWKKRYTYIVNENLTRKDGVMDNSGDYHEGFNDVVMEENSLAVSLLSPRSYGRDAIINVPDNIENTDNLTQETIAGLYGLNYNDYDKAYLPANNYKKPLEFGIPTTSSKEKITEERVKKVKDAIMGFYNKNKYLPCPADGTLDDNNTEYRNSATNNEHRNCDTSESNSSSYTGSIPTASLGINDEYMYDGWGRKIIYQVDREYLRNGDGYSDRDTKGRLGDNESVFIVRSAGISGHDSWTKEGEKINNNDDGNQNNEQYALSMNEKGLTADSQICLYYDPDDKVTCVCDNDYTSGVRWEKTKAGTIATGICDDNTKQGAKRLCKQDGTWEYEPHIGCEARKYCDEEIGNIYVLIDNNDGINEQDLVDINYPDTIDTINEWDLRTGQYLWPATRVNSTAYVLNVDTIICGNRQENGESIWQSVYVRRTCNADGWGIIKMNCTRKPVQIINP